MVICGDNFDVLSQFESDWVDSVVTDPPYGLRFMGKRWDYEVPSVGLWSEVLKVLKPGGHALVACGTRTQHRMAVNLEDAGFEIRDLVAWVYGSGFPKSHDVSKAIDKGRREKVRTPMGRTGNKYAKGLGDGRPWMERAAINGYHEHDSDIPATDSARQWQGWGTALKPSMELWTLCRKPFRGTVAENVLKYGTGAMNIDGCRVGTEKNWPASRRYAPGQMAGGCGALGGETVDAPNDGKGRWPANIIHDGSEEVVGLFPVMHKSGAHHGDSGSAARFFYCAKASKSERNAGLEGMEERIKPLMGDYKNNPGRNTPKSSPTPRANHHPTVKPVSLMRYLCRLITPPLGTVLDPFMGSGSTGIAAQMEGFEFIGIEKDEDYYKIAEARMKVPVQACL